LGGFTGFDMIWLRPALVGRRQNDRQMPFASGNISCGGYCGSLATRIVWAVAVGVVALGGACSKKAPVVQAPPPPLEVPVVPPRLVGPVVVEEPIVPTAEAPEPTPPRQRAPRPAVERGNGNGTEPVVKVEPPPQSAKPPETPNGQPSPSATNAQTGPAPLLRTDSADDESVAKGVRETLKRAEQNLNKVNYQALNPGAKAQHDTARRFIAQANDALKSRRFEFATYLAEKADRLSASLLK
jgi:hypothetical protein